MSRTNSQPSVGSTTLSETLTGNTDPLIDAAAYLKSRFSAGSTPLESDFSRLIDTLYVALTAAGLATDTPAPGNGLEIKDNKLTIKGTGAVAVSGAGVGVKVAVNSAAQERGASAGVIHNDAGGLYIRTGVAAAKKGLAQFGTNSDGAIGVYLADSSGLTFDASGCLEAVVKSQSGSLKVGDGISLNDNTVSVQPGQGIMHDAAGVGIKLSATPEGLSIDGDGGLKLIAPEVPFLVSGGGVDVTFNSVKVKLATNPGLTADDSGLKVSNQRFYQGGDGIEISDNKVNVKLINATSYIKWKDGGLAFNLKEGNGILLDFLDPYPAMLVLYCDQANGLIVTEEGLSIYRAKNSGLTVDDDGLKISHDDALQIDKGKLTISPGYYFLPGMIQQFMGDREHIPEGWAICDGSVNEKTGVRRPDLRKNFILANGDNNTKAGVHTEQDIIYIINECE
ncbi:hypothetical protein [Enterobacter bugandensis]|uniref:hypothetical protein n=1 Tax=Enterobacter bugandensis TaxID=881260 RepID=UPI002FD23997